MSTTNDLFAAKVEFAQYYRSEDRALRAHLIEVSVREHLQASRLLMAIGNELIPTLVVRIGVFKKPNIPIGWFYGVFNGNGNTIIRLSEDVNIYPMKARSRMNKPLDEHLQWDQMSLSRLHAISGKSSAD